MSIVYYATARARTFDHAYSLPAKFEELLGRVKLKTFLSPRDTVAIKTHFGSYGAFRVVRPRFVRTIVDAAQGAGGWPFVCDTVRIPGLRYLELAAHSGYTHGTVGAPVVMADGLFGFDGVKVKTGPVLGDITVASAIYDAQAMVVLSHCKGHIEAGYAGAIKNLAMGCVCASSRTRERGSRGKLHARGGSRLVWNSDLCNLCEQCVSVCPTGSLHFEKGKWIRDEKGCYQCNRCARVCPTGALTDTMEVREFQQGLAEAAKAVVKTFKPGKILYINFIMEAAPECDCMPNQDTPVVQDQGILASYDIAAIEQASYDLIGKAKPLPQSLAEDMHVKPGQHVLETINPGKDAPAAIKQMARYRLGSRKYRLVTIEKKC